ncbi:hypothetical protein OIY81_2095 [Cryptosporidium canis]|nr:hypothetical protein OIY81_2095 [Cryptosporidium canis]
MEEGYDWDQISSFQVVDGASISSSSLLDDELIIASSDSTSCDGSIPLDQSDFQKQTCSPLSQFLVGPDSPCLKSDDQKLFSQQQSAGICALGNNGSSFCLGGGHLPALGDSHHFGIQAGLANSGAGLRGDHPLYSAGYKFNDAADSMIGGDKDPNKRKRPFNGTGAGNGINICNNATANRMGNCAPNAMSGINSRPVLGMGGIGGGVAASSLNKPPTKSRARKVRDNSEEFGSSSSGSSMSSKFGYPGNSGEGGCSFNSSSNITEDLNSVKYYEGFKLPLGDLGRKMLLKKLREIHTQNPTKMEKALTDHGLSYTRIRFASVQQLFKISYVCDVFDYALSIHCEFGRPRHRDSSKNVQLSSVNSSSSSNSSLASSQSHSNVSSRRMMESQPNNRLGGAAVQGGVPDQFESHSGMGASGGGGATQNGQGLLDDSSKGLGKLESDMEAFTPDASPCSSRPYPSNKNLYSKETGAASSTPLSKVEHDITSPVSIFSTTSGSPASQRKRRGSAKSNYSFSPPPIPVTNSPMQSADQKDLSSLNSDLHSYMSNPGLANYALVNGNVPNGGMGLNSSLQMFGMHSDACTGHFSDHMHQGINQFNGLDSHIQAVGRAPHSYHKKHDDQESFDSLSSMNGSDGGMHKPPKRQKVRSRKKNALVEMRNEHQLQANFPYTSSGHYGTSISPNMFSYGDIDDVYNVSSIGEVTPFYQPESEIAHLGEFETSHHHHHHHHHYHHHHHHQDSVHYVPSFESQEKINPACPTLGSPFDSSLIINSLDTESSHNSELVECDSPTSFYLYSQPSFSSNFDDYVDSSCLSGFLSHGLNSIEMFNSSELEMDSFDIGCPLISI